MLTDGQTADTREDANTCFSEFREHSESVLRVKK
jgi:hypothetical protein